MAETSPERLQRVESHLAHVEHLCDQLNQIVTQQSRELERLKIQQVKMARALESVELERIRQTNAKPPHYQ
jgi:uncharacterized coiled-coil protein SlyX